MMPRPRLVWSRLLPGSTLSVSAQPLMAVSGVRSSWETDEMNSCCIFSAWLIFIDISLMLSTSSPSSSR